MRIKLTVIALNHNGRLFPMGEEVTSDQVPAEVLRAAVAGGAELLEAEEVDGEPLATDLPGAIAAWEETAGRGRVLFVHALELAEGQGDAGAALFRDAVVRVSDSHDDPDRLNERMIALFGSTSPEGSTIAPAVGGAALPPGPSEAGTTASPSGAEPGNGFVSTDTPPQSGAEGDGAGDDASAPEPDGSTPPQTKRARKGAAEGGTGDDAAEG